MTAPREIADDVSAIIVTYFPDAAFAERLAAIVREFPRCMVVDNSADAAVQQSLRTASRAHSAALIENPENTGLAAALNQGIAQLPADAEWAVAFDQDSTPEPGFRAALRATVMAEPGTVVVGANWRDDGRPDFASRHLRRDPRLPFLFQRAPADRDLRDITCVITSGSLFHVPTVRAVGGFDERLFLDLVDTDYCLRARSRGLKIAVASGARLRHRRGSKRAVRFAGRTWWPAFMPPKRLRYLFRNRMLLLRRYGLRFPHWGAFEFVYGLKILAEITFLEDEKRRKLAACVTGTVDGLLGRSGPLA